MVQLDLITELLQHHPHPQRADRIGEFRPITLTNSSLKIVSKVLANQLGPKFHALVGDHQTDFIVGRNILDDIVATQEVIPQAKKINFIGYLIVIDFEKTYNMVN